jgi:hypothetical protein
MAKDVAWDRPLSDEDRRYLRQRGAWGESVEKRIDTAYPPDADALAAFNARERANSVTAPGDRELLEENARLKEEIARLQAAQSDSKAEGNSDETLPFDQWSNAELEAEIARVNSEDPNAGLKKGTKAEMAAALEAYFA